MQTFDQALIDLFKGGLITLDTAKAAATNPADFVRALHFE
jgi:twitching motility protein PilT